MSLHIDQLLGSALFGGMLCFLAAGYGAGFIALCSQLAARSSHRVFLDKFGQQMTRMSLWSLATGVFLGGAILWLASSRFGTDLESLLAVDPLVLAWPGGLLVLGFVLHGLSLVLWRPLKLRHPAHLLLGLMGTAALALMVPVVVNLAGQLFWGLPQETTGPGPFWWSPVWPPRGQAFGPIVGQLLVLGPGCGGAFALIYLLRRRVRDDFGRDYYRYVAPMGARWALAFLLQVPFAAWMVWQGHPVWPGLVRQDFVWAAAVFVIMTSLATILWSLVLRSDHPMRMKAAMIGGGLCVWLAVSAQVLGAAWIHELF